MIEIKNISGEVLLSVPILEDAVVHEELMSDDYIRLSWDSDMYITLPSGAYIEYNGERYSLISPYTPSLQNEAHARYTPQFYSRIIRWQKVIVPVYTYEDDGVTVKKKELDWNFLGTPADVMFMIKQALKEETGEEWNVTIGDDMPETVSISAQSSSVWSLLSELAEQCNTEWWADKAANWLYLSKCIHGTSTTLEVGKNVKNPSLSQDSDEYFTRFYAFGSSRNITQDAGMVQGSLVNKRLTLDPVKYPNGYKDIRGHFEDGVFVSDLLPEEVLTTSLYFEDIYPSSPLKISGVRKRMRYRLEDDKKIMIGGTDEAPVYDTYAIWYFQIPELTFSEDLIIKNQELSVRFNSGQLRGMEFTLKYHSENRNVTDNADVDDAFFVYAGEYEIIMQEQNEGLILPSVDYLIPSDGDEAILFNIEMPEEYITSAWEDLEKELDKELDDRRNNNKSYEFDSNPVAFYNNKIELSVGKRVTFICKGEQIETRILMIESRLDAPCRKKIKVGNKIIKGSRQQLKDEVRNVGEEVNELHKSTQVNSVTLRNNSRDIMISMGRYYAMQNTLSMLQSAFENFSDGINPVTVRTMAMLVGDESLQFIFTDSRESLNRLEGSPLVYDSLTKQINSVPCALIHMTLGIDDITAKNIRSAKEYMSWDMEEWHSQILEEKDKSYYVYAIVERNGQIGTYHLSENPLKMEEPVQIDGFTDTCNLLVGILNSEYADTREFIPLHGFTEVLPGQITTDVIRSADGSCYFDLANNEIGGAIKFLPGTSGIENLGLEVGGQNMLRNSGFTGDYLSEQLADDRVLTATDKMYNPPLVHWDATNVEVVEDAESASGYAASMTSGSLKQTLSNAIIAGETYVLSFKAKGTSLLYYIGKHQPVTISLTDEWKYYSFQIKASFSTNEFEISGTNSICEVQLERGTVATGWSNSPFDNRSDRAYYQALEYLASALEGSTTVNGGLVLTRDIRVGNYANKTMTRETGGMRGVWTSDDDVYQWGGGDYDQAVATVAKFKDNPTYQPTQEELKAMANYVVTHGGLAILNNAIVRGAIYSDKGNFSGEINATQGSIGGFKINYNFIGSEATASGMSLFDGFIRFTDATSQQDDKKAYYGSGIGVPEGWMAYVHNHTTDPYSLTSREGKGVYSSVSGYKDNYAYYCPSGVFAGLRPNIRVITDPADATLTEYDHTIITSVDLTLPSNPQKGQTYRIWFDRQLIIGGEEFFGGGIIDVIYTGTEWKMFHSKPITTD